MNRSIHKKHKSIPSKSGKYLTRLRIIWFCMGMLAGGLLSLLIFETAGKLQDAKMKEHPVAALPEKVPENEKEPQTEEEEEPEPISWPQHIDFTVAKGDTLAGILNEHGVTTKDAYNVIETMKGKFDPRKLREGHNLYIVLRKDETRENEEAALLSRLTIFINKLESLHIYRNPEDRAKYRVEYEKKSLTSKMAYAKGVVKEGSSLSKAAASNKVPTSIVNKLIKAYSYDVDFQRDIRPGTEFEILYEKLVAPDGSLVKGGDVSYANLKIKGKDNKIYYYEDKYTPGKFYNEKGKSIVKTLLRTPIDGARISSGFGRRKHPILGYSRMHTGIDFAAPTGTKIYAAGDGVITFVGRRGGYGKYISIKHNGTYSTAYAHCSRFARNMKKGKRVRQGQVIAYVGSTGRSTGPHLHYEIIKNGKKINPNNVKFLSSGFLSQKQQKIFADKKAEIVKQIESLSKPSINNGV